MRATFTNIQQGLRWLWRCLGLLVVLAPLAVGAAQEPGGRPAAQEYEIALASALEAHARGEYEAARVFLERAHAIEPSARTFRGLGIVAFAQERHFDAIRLLDQALASDVKPLPDDLRKSTGELLALSWAQVGRIELAIDPPSGDFLVDGREPEFYAEHTLVLAPGAHTLTARAPARAPYELTLEVRPGDHRTLQLVLAVPPPPLVTERVVYRVPPSPDAPAKLRPAFYTPAVRWTAIGVGGALTLGGIALWGVGYARLLEVDQRCRDMVPAGCTKDEAQRGLDARNVPTFAVASGVTAGVGLATLVTVGVLELWHHKQRRGRVEVRAGARSFEVRKAF